MSAKHYPVLIVGAGPVGLALSGDLGWRGVGNQLVEIGDGSIHQPKMDMVGIRTMEFCRRWGIADWVVSSPYPRNYPQDNVWVESLTGYEFGREVMVSKDEEPIPPQSPQKRERCPQDMFDPILTRFVRAQNTSAIAYKTEMVDFDDAGDMVVVTLRDLSSGEERTVTADYLVGTDGAASKTREKLGIKMHGKPVLTYTTNVIFRCKDLPELHDKGKAYRFIFIGREGTWLTIVAIDGKDRWRMSVVGDATKRSFTEDEIRELLFRAMGKPFDYEIESVMPWVRRQLVAESFQKGRVFLAGDSCHLTSPTGGFGMNMGIADAIDLSWKLDAALKGWGGPLLLESYTVERRPVAMRAVSEASRNLGRMLATRSKGPPEAAFHPGPEGDRTRQEYGQWFTETMRPEWYSIGIHLGFNYYHSPVVSRDGTPEPEDRISDYEQSGRPGHRAPHFWLDDGRSSLDLFGKGFVLLDLSGTSRDLSDLQQAAASRSVPLEIVALPVSDEVMRAYGATLSLVRPDGHVAWRGEMLPRNSAELIDLVCGLDETAAILPPMPSAYIDPSLKAPEMSA